MIPEKSTVIAGFSGGADSTALVLSLYELRKLLDIRLIAVHINHMIREEADRDAEFVSEFCKERGIECFVEKIDIPKLSKDLKMTEEEAGRKARYDLFSKKAAECGTALIAIAHHQNDVAETLLMNLIRGSGLHGAGAIRPVRDNVIRPLLCVSRNDIEEYLEEKKQAFCHDITNDENIHTRNIIRNILIPTMEKDLNSAAVRHLYSAALRFAKADELIRSMAEELFADMVKIFDKQAYIETDRINELNPVLKEEIILMVFEKLTPHRKDISSIHIEDIIKLMESSEGTASINLPYGLIAERSYNKLFIKAKDTKILHFREETFEIPKTMGIGDSMDITVPKLGIAHIRILKYNGGKLFPTSAYTKWFDYDRIQEAVFRNSHSEDFILLEQKNGFGKKKISKLFTDEKVPKSDRNEIFLLADGSSVIWVPGIRMSGAFKITEKTRRILEINIDNGGFING